jgi:competence protein ComEC
VKLPALWLVLAFGGGIATGKWRLLPSRTWLVFVLAMLFFGIVLYFRKQLPAAWTLVLVAWFALGGLAIRLQQNYVATSNVARYITAGKLDASEPLRWRGRLREDPESLPWGWRYTIELQSVEVGAKEIPITGGLRLTLYYNRGDETPPAVRAGDRIEALARAQIPRNYLDPGAFDERGYLQRQGISLLGTLRSAALIQLLGSPSPTLIDRLVRVRGDLLGQLDRLYSTNSSRLAVLRAMLLGDRNFVNSDISTAFQKTAAFHILVVAGLHVGALAVFVFWLGRILRLPRAATTLITLAVLCSYAGIVQDRPPILRATLMAAVFLCARMIFRRVALANTVSMAALILLLARPEELFDASFQLSFIAAGVIAGLGVPWIERTSGACRGALEHLSDTTRDEFYSFHLERLRFHLRTIANRLITRMPRVLASRTNGFVIAPVRVLLRLWEIFVLSFSIQIGMVPLLALYFHRVSLSGPVSNVPAVLLTTFIVPLGFLSLVLSFLWVRLGVGVAKLVSFLVGLLLTSVDWFSKVPNLSWRIPGPPSAILVIFFAALALSCVLAWRAAERHRKEKKTFGKPRGLPWGEFLAFSLVLLLACFIATYPFAPSLAKGQLEATVLDVGQGDSIFISFPDGKTMLVDGGGAPGTEHIGGYSSGIDIGEEVVSPFLWAHGIKKLDVVLLSHAHQDHIGGLPAVLRNFRVGQLWVGRDEDDEAYRLLLEQARTEDISIVHEAQGRTFNWDGVKGEILWPENLSEAPAAANNDSVVLRLGDGSVHFLLAGDIEKEVETNLVGEHEPLAADFLKVPHHGSKTSSTQKFLDVVNPRVAVISVGRGNSYGLPSPGVLHRYEEMRVRLLITEHDGAVTVSTDGKSLKVQSYVESTSR